MGADGFPLRGLEEVNAGFSLMATACNLARAMSLLGFGGLMEAVRGWDGACGELRPALGTRGGR